MTDIIPELKQAPHPVAAMATKEEWLNLDDIVTEDDTPVDNFFSEKQQRLLTEPLYSSWEGPGEGREGPGEGREGPGEGRTFLAAANVGLFASVRQPPLVPDVFLSLDVQVAEDWYDKSHRTYFFWEFGKPPDVVIEIVSNRKGGETGSKMRDYARMGIAYYVIFDPLEQAQEGRLRVYELLPQRIYSEKESEDLPGIGLGLTLWQGLFEGKEGVWLRWQDPAGNLILTGAERAKEERERAKEERKRAEQERERAEQEHRRAERLAAQLRALGVEPDED